MKIEVAVSRWHALWAVVMAVMLISCGGSNEVGSESLISGDNNKTWKAAKESDGAGEEQEVTQAESRENIQFYADGRFAMGGGSMLQTGTWAFDQAARRLTLQFEDEDMTQNFEVLKLTADEMLLKAPEGAELRLKSE